MTKCTHGTIDGIVFTTTSLGAGRWRADAAFTFTLEGNQKIRIPATFTVLGAARTRLVTLTPGTNSLSFSLELDDPKGGNPFSFLGTDEAEALIRIDGAEVSAPVSFA